MADVFNDTVDIGADWYLQVTWQDENGTPINLTGYTFALNVAENYSTDAVINLTLGSGITVSAPLTGVILCHITNTQSAISEGTYVYDLYATAAGGQKTRLVQGRLEFTSKVQP